MDNPLIRWWRAAARSWSGPLNAKSPEIARLWAGQSVSSGISVSEETALNYSAVWAAVSLISDDIASLPLMLYRRLPTGGKDRYEDHALYRLLHDAPNPEMSSMVFRRTVTAHVLTWGNGYAEIQRDGAGRPVALWLITPDRVQPFREAGRLRYRVSNPTQPAALFDANDIVHVPGLGFDGVQGYSVIAKARESIGLGVAAERFGGTFFGNGSTFGGVISFPTDPPELTKENTRKALEGRHTGVEKAHKFLTLYGGAKYDRLGIPPNDAQFLETRVFQVREIARWFKLPPHKLADLADATFSNVEQQTTDYYTSCLRPWLELWEQELGRKLIAPLERRIQFIEHVTEGFLRADAAGRSTLYTSQFRVASITPNEIRQRENLDPLDGGDRAFVPLDMMPLDRVDEWVSAQIAAKAPKEPAQPSAEDTQAQTDALRAAIAALEAMQAEQGERLATDAQERAVLTVRLTDAHAAEQQARADLAKARHEADEARATAQAVTADRDRALADWVVEDQRSQALQADVAVKTAALADAEAARAAASAAVAREQQRAEQVSAALAQAEQTLADLRQQLAARDLTCHEAEARYTAEVAARRAAEAAQAAAELQVTIVTREAASVREAIGDLGVLRGQLAATEEARHMAERAAAAARAEADEQRARLQVLDSAHRVLLADAWQRVINREVDRVRRAAGTPAKLRRHCEEFYSLHEDVCVAALRPPVRAWLVARGQGDRLDGYVTHLVAEAINESLSALRLLLDTEEEDRLAAAVERVIGRWEIDRADLLVDRMIRQGGA